MSTQNVLDKPGSRSRRLLMLLLTIAVFGVFFYVSENAAYLNDGNRTPLLDSEFFFAVGAALLLGVIYLIAAFRYYHVRLKPFLLGLSLLFALGGTCAALLFSGVNVDGQLAYMPTAMEKARSVAGVLVEALGVYLVFAIMPQVLRGKLVFKVFSAIFVIVVFAAIFYSYLHESEIYAFLFDNGYFKDPYFVPQSWTTNRNVYAMFIFMGIICECYLHEQHPHWWRWAIILFFALNQIFILSKTILIVTAIFLPCYYIYRIIVVYKDHKVRDVLTAIMTFGIVIAVTIMYFNGTVNAYAYPFARIFGSLVTTLRESSDRSFGARVKIWSTAYRTLSLDNTALMFGWGEYLWQNALDAIFKTKAMPCDSSYVTTLFKYGYLGILIYGALIFYVVIKAGQLIFRGDRSGWFFVIFGGVYLLFSISESHIILSLNGQALMMFMTLVLPVLVQFDNEKQQALIAKEFSSKFLAKDAKPRQKALPIDVYQRSLILLTPIFLGVLTLGLSFSRAFSSFSFRLSPLGVAALTVLGFISPFLIASISNSWRLGQKKQALWLVFSLATTIGVFFVGLFVHEIGLYCVFGLGLLWMVTLIFLHVLPPWKSILKRSWLLWIAYFAALLMNVFAVTMLAPFTPDLAYSLLALDFLFFIFAMVVRIHRNQTDWYYLSHWDRLEKWYSRVDAWQTNHDPTTIV